MTTTSPHSRSAGGRLERVEADVLKSVPDAGRRDSSPIGDPTITDARLDGLSTPDGVTMADVEDLGAGRGPDWLDGWLERHAADIVAWRRHIHANPDLARRECSAHELR